MFTVEEAYDGYYSVIVFAPVINLNVTIECESDPSKNTDFTVEITEPLQAPTIPDILGKLELTEDDYLGGSMTFIADGESTTMSFDSIPLDQIGPLAMPGQIVINVK